MSELTSIEWTNSTWNPATGCTKVGRGCDNCYAETLAERFRGVKNHPYEQGFDLRLWHDRLDIPKRWIRPRRIFVNSMSDLFHKEIPRLFIDRVFDTMEAANHHIYQVLTKRSSLMRDYVKARYKGQTVPHHIWLGVSVEDSDYVSRIRHLSQVNCGVRFISFEPLLGSVGNVDLSNIEWVIVGGESGRNFRPMKESWAIEIRDLCLKYDVPFFFKQWGGIRPKSGGNKLDGQTYLEFPRPTELTLG